MGALILQRSSRLPQTQDPNIFWVQKGAQNKLIRDAPFPESSFICLSKVLINEPPPGSPMGAHMEKIVHFHSLLLHVPQIPE